MDDNKKNIKEDKAKRYERVLLLLEQAEAEIVDLRREGQGLKKEMLVALDQKKQEKVWRFVKSLPDDD